MSTTKTKTLKNFEEISSDVTKKNHKKRQNQSDKQTNSNIMENSTNNQMIAAAAKYDAPATNDAPANDNEISIKKYATEIFEDFKEITFHSLCMESLLYALQKMYGAQKGHFVYYGFVKETENGKYNYANNVDEKIKNDVSTKEITLKVTKGNTTTIYTWFRFFDGFSTTVASIVAKYNAWFNFCKRTNNAYIRDIINIDKEQKEQNKLNNTINNASDEMLINALMNNEALLAKLLAKMQK